MRLFGWLNKTIFSHIFFLYEVDENHFETIRLDSSTVVISVTHQAIFFENIIGET